MHNKEYHALAVVPYEGMRYLIEKVAAERFPQMEIVFASGDYDEGFRAARENYDINTFDVIISRGGTASLLRTHCEPPVIDISINGIDIISAWNLAGLISERFAFFCHQNLARNVRRLKELLHWDRMDVYEYSPREERIDHDEIYRTLETIRSNGIRTILGDTAAVNAAQKSGFNAVAVTSSEYSITEGLSRAVQLCEATGRCKDRVLLLDDLLSFYPAPIVLFDRSGQLVYRNKAGSAPELLRILSDEAVWVRGSEGYSSTISVGEEDYDLSASSLTSDGNGYHLYYARRKPQLPESLSHSVRFLSLGSSKKIAAESFYGLLQTSAELGNLNLRLSQEMHPLILNSEKGMEIESLMAFLHTTPPFDKGPLIMTDCSAQPITEGFLQGLIQDPDAVLSRDGALICFLHAEKMSPSDAETLCEAIKGAGAFGSHILFQIEETTGHAPEARACRRVLERELYAANFRLKPLREIRQEIPALASCIISRINQSTQLQVDGLEDGAVEELSLYSWPGNLQQFRKILPELAFSCSSGLIETDSVRSALCREQELSKAADNPSENSGYIALKGSLEDMTTEIARAVLSSVGGNQTKAAKRLGISRTTLWRLLKR